MSVYRMNPREMYESYVAQENPESLIHKGRTAIAKHLMENEGLDDQYAYYAADMILQYAEEQIGQQRTQQ